MLRVKDFDYNLPKELIAQKPAKPRDYSRLFVLNKRSKKISHKHFYDIVDYFKKGDVLVMNNSKVFPARLIGRKKNTGGKVEVLLLKKEKGRAWQCLVGGLRGREDLEIEFGQDLICKILKNNDDGTWLVGFNKSEKEMMNIVEKIGQVPLPPYIKRKGKRVQQDKISYQTVYADDRKLGSVAVATAGLHFTKNLIKKLKNKGVQIEYVTLHVGLGTFAPVKVDDIKKHKMHSEYVEISATTAKRIIKAKKEKRRIIAVGTTSVRSLESMLDVSKVKNKKLKGWVDIFIYPGYKFKIVDAMITNFHLPKSTLLMLVSAFAGQKLIKKSYQIAIKNKYRFFSYGDAMLIIS